MQSTVDAGCDNSISCLYVGWIRREKLCDEILKIELLPRCQFEYFADATVNNSWELFPVDFQRIDNLQINLLNLFKFD